MVAEGIESQLQEAPDATGVVLTFQPTDVRLDLGVGQSPHGLLTDIALVYSLTLPPGEELELSSGENARNMPLRLRVTTGRQLKDPDCTGVAYYSEKLEAEGFSDPARIHFDVDVPNQRFSVLLGLARAGKHPNRISLQVLGMQYGPLPDGSVKEWDTADKSKHKLLISYIDCSFVLTPAEGPTKQSATAGDAALSKEMLRTLEARLKGLRDVLWWILAILTALLAALIWRML